jgi:hypothetical protein
MGSYWIGMAIIDPKASLALLEPRVLIAIHNLYGISNSLQSAKFPPQLLTQLAHVVQQRQ